MSNINQDIQASHKILTLLETANSYSEKIIDDLPGIFLVINEKYEILRANREASKIFEIEPNAILRFPFLELFSREVSQLFECQFNMLKHSDRMMNIQFELNVSDKNSILIDHPYYWHLSRFSNAHYAEGQLFILTGEDILLLRESEKKLVSLFSSIPLGIFTVNERGKIEETYSNYLGYLLGESEYKEKTFTEVLFGPIESSLTRCERKGIENITKCLNREERYFSELVDTFPTLVYYHDKNKKESGKYLQISYKPLCYDGVVKKMLVILEDRTTIVCAEKERKRVSLLEQQSRALYESAIRDPLTGLYTRLGMEEHVNRMVGGHNGGDFEHISLLLFDLDHFKEVNDNYGHDVGDKVLKKVGSSILDMIRQTDVAIRFGGEEIMVFIANSIENGYSLAERIRKKIESTVFQSDNMDFSVTLSGGVVGHEVNEDLADLIRRADKLLYQAKERGRNCICTDISEADG